MYWFGYYIEMRASQLKIINISTAYTIKLILKVPEQTQIAEFNATDHSITFKMIMGVYYFSLVGRCL